ncbi:hypothetical protein ACFL28_01520 [Candidatus Omnitrophota bacterium]
MKTIVISGSHSNIGKTSLAERFIRILPNWSALKITVVRKSSRCPRDVDCGVCSKLKGDFDIVSEAKIINEKHTDTCRMKKAGAKKVIWLKASLKGLKEGLKKALYRLRDSEGVVIESTTVLKYIKPNLAIYLKGNAKRPKPSSSIAQKKADIIINVGR